MDLCLMAAFATADWHNIIKELRGKEMLEETTELMLDLATEGETENEKAGLLRDAYKSVYYGSAV
jgi:hypothetical protein